MRPFMSVTRMSNLEKSLASITNCPAPSIGLGYTDRDSSPWKGGSDVACKAGKAANSALGRLAVIGQINPYHRMAARQIAFNREPRLRIRAKAVDHHQRRAGFQTRAVDFQRAMIVGRQLRQCRALQDRLLLEIAQLDPSCWARRAQAMQINALARRKFARGWAYDHAIASHQRWIPYGGWGLNSWSHCRLGRGFWPGIVKRDILG